MGPCLHLHLGSSTLCLQGSSTLLPVTPSWGSQLGAGEGGCQGPFPEPLQWEAPRGEAYLLTEIQTLVKTHPSHLC